MTDRKIIARIRKVLAKAEGTDNPHEAEMLMAKVHGMLSEHNMELLDIETAATDDPIGTDKFVDHCWKPDSWIKNLAMALGALYGIEVIYHTTKAGPHKNKIRFSACGRESGRVTWQLMLPFVIKQTRAKARELRAEVARIAAPAGRKPKSKRSIERSVGNALTYRIWGMVGQAQEADDRRRADGKFALVPVDLVQAEVERVFPSLREAPDTALRTTAGAREKASEISLHRQTTGEQRKQIGGN